MRIWSQKLLFGQLFQRNRFVKKGSHHIQRNKELALTLLVIVYFLINYWTLEYFILTTNSYVTIRLNSNDSTSAGISFEIPSSTLIYIE